jgi:hypothetical protein
MIKKLKHLLYCLPRFKNSIRKHGFKACSEGVNCTDTKSQVIQLEIEWEDICRSTPNSKNSSIISKAMRRNGYYGYSTECLMILENGDTYLPQELSDHWEAFIGSEKFKPKMLTYHKID